MASGSLQVFFFNFLNFLYIYIYIYIYIFFFFFCESVGIVSKGQFYSLDSFSCPKNLRENNRSVQNADCRPSIKCRLQTGCKMQTENLNCFFVCYVITCHHTITTNYRVSRNRFSAIIFHDPLHFCGIFLARFLIYFVFNRAAIAFWFLTKRPQSFFMKFEAFV